MTPEPAQISKEISTLQSENSGKLQFLLKQAQTEGWAEEGASVAIRDVRAVFPVSSANKLKLKGIVDDGFRIFPKRNAVLNT